MSIEIQLANGQTVTVDSGKEAWDFFERAQTRPAKKKRRKKKTNTPKIKEDK